MGIRTENKKVGELGLLGLRDVTRKTKVAHSFQENDRTAAKRSIVLDDLEENRRRLAAEIQSGIRLRNKNSGRRRVEVAAKQRKHFFHCPPIGVLIFALLFPFHFGPSQRHTRHNNSISS
jgi:hypothetical protein